MLGPHACFAEISVAVSTLQKRSRQSVVFHSAGRAPRLSTSRLRAAIAGFELNDAYVLATNSSSLRCDGAGKSDVAVTDVDTASAIADRLRGASSRVVDDDPWVDTELVDEVKDYAVGTKKCCSRRSVPPSSFRCAPTSDGLAMRGSGIPVWSSTATRSTTTEPMFMNWATTLAPTTRVSCGEGSRGQLAYQDSPGTWTETAARTLRWARIDAVENNGDLYYVEGVAEFLVVNKMILSPRYTPTTLPRRARPSVRPNFFAKDRR